jgi:hypothetical protein
VIYTPPAVIDEDSPLPTVSCTLPSGSTFPIGRTTVTCTVHDTGDTPNIATTTFTVTVKSALAQLNDLLAYVQTLPPAAGLTAKVQSAITYLQANDLHDTCGTLGAIINQATAKSGKVISAAQANNVIVVAMRIEAVLNC